jgi:salicylate hydroxylase
VSRELLVAGGGIAGLAAAIAAREAGWDARLFEQAQAFGEAGAGLQLGPNATRALRDWGVLDRPQLRAFEPVRLRVRDAVDGRDLGTLRLRGRAAQVYGAPYLTIHRADLHAALLAAAQERGAWLHAGTRIASLATTDAGVQARTEEGKLVEADAAAIADGVWSALRERVVGDGPAPASGHVAYRALLPMDRLDAGLRSDEVQAWLGPSMHLVSYPVRGGEALNIAGFTEGHAGAGWEQATQGEGLRTAARTLCRELQALVDAVDDWKLWPVHDRPPVRSAQEMAAGRAVLLGDAAHPMRPYLAQGAGMAIEDAGELQRMLRMCDGRVVDVPTALRRYALNRFERCGRVQKRSRRNGVIFHADGALRWARNAAMRVAGERLIDLPWLYRG